MRAASSVKSDIVFRTEDAVNFRASSSADLTEVSVYTVDASSGDPTYYLLKKSVKASAGDQYTETFSFGDPQKFIKVVLGKSNVIDIENVTDSDGSTWYWVPYLAQDTVFVEVPNIEQYDPDLSQYNDSVPYLLKLKKTARRFITQLRSDNKIELQFGSGVSSDPDEVIIPDPTLVGSALPGGTSKLDVAFDSSNFLYTKTYGQVPQSTTLTVKYIFGGGIESNVQSNVLTNIVNIAFGEVPEGLSAALVNQSKDSVACTNPQAAVGGKSQESVDEIKLNAMAHFATQRRAVTKDDYIIRVYSMPARLGSIAKAYVVQDDQLNIADRNEETRRNPLALNLYLLGYDSNKKLVALNDAVKQNVKTYLGQYRILTDAVNIHDGYIINIGVNFEIIVFPNFNKREVVVKCIEALKEYFRIDKWQFNQPIILAEVHTLIAGVEGVQSVVSVKFVNKYDKSEGYSGNVYNLVTAMRNNVIYNSLDTSIFEIKFANTDILGRSVSI